MNTQEMKRLVGKIMKVNRLHRSVISDSTATHNLQRSGHMMLLYIMHCKTPPSQKDIAKVFNVTPAAVAMTLKKMEGCGLIVRTPSSADSRVNLIEVSESGRKMMEKNRQRFEVADRAMLKGIDETELAKMSETLDKMIENLIKVGAKDENAPFVPPKHD